jgi:methylenetetrahydrofolate dehydrogenase (NADP+) / methenyltetrahydrofolate cyclohydrolase
MLDGRALAAARLPRIAERAAQVRARRARAPALLLIAFPGEDRAVPHVGGKLRACAAAGIEAIPLLIGPAGTASAAVASVSAAIALHDPDAVFVQVPVPPAFDADAIIAAIPQSADIDVMTGPAFTAYMSGAAPHAPVTIVAALELLDAGCVDVRGLRGVLLAGTSPFTVMFAESLTRRGAQIETLQPEGDGWRARIAAAELVVAAAGRPGLVSTADLAPGTVALDIGYFNEGGCGDIDVVAGTAHLAALMPVPGGVGPMTVSVLLERVVELSERALA